MNRNIYISLTIITSILLFSCSASKNVPATSYASLKNTTDSVKTTMQADGFKLVDSKSLGLEKTKQDSYTFKDDNGSTMEYSVSYVLDEDSDNKKFVENVSVVGCKTSEGDNYDKYCGTDAKVRQLENLPNDITVKKFSAGKLVFNLVGAPLLILGAITGIGYLVLIGM